MISVKVIAHSKIIENNIEIITYELEYPRFIHAELLTHRLFSRNAASSRAIPIKAMIDQALNNTAIPVWTAKNPGMQGPLLSEMEKIHTANDIWLEMLNAVAGGVASLDDLGIHKQNANRALEPFQHIKTVLTAVDLDNFFTLRSHTDAQPEIEMLSNLMMVRKMQSTPKMLKAGDWHVPYAEDVEDLIEARMISASCCAQVSYRKNDDSLEKAEIVFDRLINSEPAHMSPFEHQCTPLPYKIEQRGNLRGFRQYRQVIEDTGWESLI